MYGRVGYGELSGPMGSAHDGRRGGSSLSGPLDGFPPTTEEDGLRGRGGGAGAMASASGRHGGSSLAIPPAAPAGGTKGNAKGNRRSFHRRRLALKVAVVVLAVISAFAAYLSLTGRSGVVEEKVDRLKQTVGRKMDKVKSKMDRVKKTTVDRPRRAAKALMEHVHDTADRYHLHLPASDQGERGELLETNVRLIDKGLQPFVMIKSKLDDNLLSRFLDEHLYSCEEDTLPHVPDLDSRVSPPVYVYEGHYHALATGGTVYSKNPDPTKGNDFDKPAAGRFTRAFYMAFREVNGEIFDGLRKELVKASSHGTTGTDDACYILAQWIERGYHFADLSVQIHYGEGNRPKLVSGAAWHADAENSLLHLALTLRGERKLHTRRNRAASASVRGGKLSPAEIVEGQSPGDLYLTSSTLVRHAPEFGTTTYEERVVAIHARILYTNDEIRRFREARTPEGWRKMIEVLSKTLARAKLVVPSLHQVDRQLARL